MQSLQRPHSAGYHATTFVSDRAAFLEWFSTVRHDRSMPWRRRPAEGESFKQMRAKLSKDQLAQWAYEVLISEVMLQQTQVTTVIPYFNRWILKFPTISALSQGTTEDVHALWTGLGYYSRATRLLSAAQKVMADYDGHLPSSPQILEKDIPGIGPYTAGAISSIAYGVKAPLVDGNVHRVLTRLLGIHSNPTGKPLISTLWEKAAELVPADRPGDWNEALMELGARICRPTEAKCGECPLANSCRANAEMNMGIPPPAPEDIEDLCQICVPIPPKTDAGPTASTSLDPTVFPMKAVKKKAREESMDMFLVEYKKEDSSELGMDEIGEQSSWLVVKRPEKGLLAGLYEFPSFPHSSADSPPDPATVLSYLFPTLRSSERPVVKKLVQLDTVFHQFSHISMTYHVSHLVLTPSTSQTPSAGDKRDRRPSDLMDRAKWVEGKSEVERLSMATGGKNCWKLLNGGKGKERPKPRVKSGSKKPTPDSKSKARPEKAETSKSITSFFKPKPKIEPEFEAMGESGSIDLVSSGDDLAPPRSSAPLAVKSEKGKLAPLPPIKRKNPSRGGAKSYVEVDLDDEEETVEDAEVKRSRRV